MNDSYALRSDESIKEYCHRICSLRDTLGLTWDDVCSILNDNLGCDYSPDKYRKEEYKYRPVQQEVEETEPVEQFEETDLFELRKERMKLSDERTQVNAVIRRIAREETLKEMAKEVASTMNEKIRLEPIQKVVKKGKNEAILQISDWHYGIEIDNYWNVFNPDIAKKRIEQLRDKVVQYCEENDVKTLYAVNLGDLIAGRIHLQLRLNSRQDVVTQTIQVSELLAEMLNSLATRFNVEYFDTLDNHSRIEPNIKDSMDLESLARFTTWYLQSRLKGIRIHDNTYGDDIITFEVLGHKVVGVHGHKDKPSKIIQNMTMMTQQHYDLALTAHLHHFQADEQNQTILVSNGSLMGTDDYAEKLRLTSNPSQNLIIVSKENPIECLYRIVLD